MTCMWCGSGRLVGMVRKNGQPMRSQTPGVPLHLCYRCWGSYKESGMRQDQTGVPQPGPITGIPLTTRLLRGLR